jgi:lipid-A-disaccharide synthase
VTTDAGIDLVIADNASLLTAADLVLVASGTATLHVAYYRKPMIVMYDAGRLLYWPHRLFGRLVITTPQLSLVNVLAGARVVPEFMPFIRDLAPVATVAAQLLTDATWRKLMTDQLDAVVRPLEDSQASTNVCRMIAEMLSASPTR